MFPFKAKSYDKYIEELAIIFKNDTSAFTTAIFASSGWHISDEHSRDAYRIRTENNGKPVDIYISYTGREKKRKAFEQLTKKAGILFSTRQFGTIMLNSFTFSKIGEFEIGQSKNGVKLKWENLKLYLGQKTESLIPENLITEYDIQCPDDKYVDYISLTIRNGKSLDGIFVYFKKSVNNIMAIEALKGRFGQYSFHNAKMVIWSRGPFNIFYEYKNNYICTHDRR